MSEASASSSVDETSGKRERETEERARREREERQRKEKEEAHRKDKEDRQRKEKEEAQRKEKEETQRKEKEETQRKEKEERQRRERDEAQRKDKEERQRKDKEEALRKEREQRQRKEKGDAATPVAAGGGGLLSACTAALPALPVLPALPPEVTDLALGILIVFVGIAAFALSKWRGQRAGKQRAMSRSLSCNALVQLHSPRALDACAQMLAAFDEQECRSPGRRTSLAPSLPCVSEVSGENSNAWTPRSSPRESPRHSPRESPRPSPRLFPLRPESASPRSTLLSSPRSSPRQSPPLSSLSGYEDGRGLDSRGLDGRGSRGADSVCESLCSSEGCGDPPGPPPSRIGRDDSIGRSESMGRDSSMSSETGHHSPQMRLPQMLVLPPSVLPPRPQHTRVSLHASPLVVPAVRPLHGTLPHFDALGAAAETVLCDVPVPSGGEAARDESSAGSDVESDDESDDDVPQCDSIGLGIGLRASTVHGADKLHEELKREGKPMTRERAASEPSVTRTGLRFRAHAESR